MAKLQEWGSGESLFSSWEDAANLIKFESNRIYNLRLIGGSLLLKYAWVPFLKKGTGKVKLFPQMVPSYDHTTGEYDDSIDDPVLALDVKESNMGIGYCIDIDSLFENPKKTEKVIRIVKFGPREGGRIRTLAALNRNNQISDYRYGRIIQTIYDADAADPANRFQFSLSEKLPIKDLGDNRILVKIPEDADSDYAGKKFKYELGDLADLVYPQSLEDIRQKIKVLRVEEAIEIYAKKNNKKKRNKTSDDEEEENDNTRSSKKKTLSGMSKRIASKLSGKNIRDDLEDSDNDWDDDDDDEEDRPKKKKKSKKVKDDDDWDDDDDEEEEDRPKKKNGKTKRCFGKIGSSKTDDCTQCTIRNRCVKETRSKLGKKNK